jgi:hypothetical protein
MSNPKAITALHANTTRHAMATNANEILDRLAALLDAATPGPWAPRGDTWIEAGPRGFDDVVAPDCVKCGEYCQGGSSRIEFRLEDRAAIVALRNAAPALIRLARAAAILAEDAHSTEGGTMLRDGIKALGDWHRHNTAKGITT